MSCIPKPSCGQEPQDTYLREVREEKHSAGASAAHCPQKTTVPLEHHCPLARQDWVKKTGTSSFKNDSNLFPNLSIWDYPTATPAVTRCSAILGTKPQPFASRMCLWSHRLRGSEKPSSEPRLHTPDIHHSAGLRDICSSLKPIITVADLYLQQGL